MFVVPPMLGEEIYEYMIKALYQLEYKPLLFLQLGIAYHGFALPAAA